MCCNGGARPRTLTFHFAGDSGGSELTSEIRVSPVLPRAFGIKSIEVIPIGGVQTGQFVDVLVSPDSDLTDTLSPTGLSVFEPPQGTGGLAVVDQDNGLPVADSPYDVPMAFRCEELQRTLKVVSRYRAPASGLPSLHVVIVVEEFDLAPTPIVPRPPVVPPRAPAPGPEDNPNNPTLPPGGDPNNPTPPYVPAPLPPDLPVPTVPPDLSNCVNTMVSQYHQAPANARIQCQLPDPMAVIRKQRSRTPARALVQNPWASRGFAGGGMR